MISKRQKKFLSFYQKWKRDNLIDIDNYSVMVKSVVYSLFEMYIIATRESDKQKIAWNIYRLRDEIKGKIKLWHLIENKEEFKRLVTNEHNLRNEQAITNQKRRHEKRDDFALSEKEWEETKEYFNYQCAYCSEYRKLTYDHFFPFSKGGDFMKGNIIPACSSCNSSKKDRLFKEWYPKQEFYRRTRANKIISFIESNRQLALL